MAWSERQRRMLAEMGITVWLPEEQGQPADAVPQSDSPPQAPARVAQQQAPVPEASPAAAVPAPAVESPAASPAASPMGRMAGPPPAAAQPRPAADPRIAAMGWAELREAVAECRACRLCEGRRNTVFGVGNERAHLMVVGEAPGEQEDRKGEPFVGPAGHLLDAMLRALGLTRDAAEPERQVFIANTLKCRPPGNRNPEPDEMVKCEPFLQRQLALVQPRVILAMGRFAVQALLRSNEPIGRLRGRVHQYEGVPLVVTYHPAYLLRNLPDKAKAWDDLCLAATLLGKAG